MPIPSEVLRTNDKRVRVQPQLAIYLSENKEAIKYKKVEMNLTHVVDDDMKLASRFDNIHRLCITNNLIYSNIKGIS